MVRLDFLIEKILFWLQFLNEPPKNENAKEVFFLDSRLKMKMQ